MKRYIIKNKFGKYLKAIKENRAGQFYAVITDQIKKAHSFSIKEIAENIIKTCKLTTFYVEEIEVEEE